MSRSIVLVEDDPKIRATVSFQLEDQGYTVRTFRDAEDALGPLTDDPPDLLLLDVRLPGESGVDLVRRLVASDQLPPTIVITGEASVSEAVEALQLGVHELIEKPFSRERLLRSVENTLDHRLLRRRVEDLEAELGQHRALLGRSAAMEHLRQTIARAAPTDARVLVRGESGTGKELVADALHEGSSRRRGPFVKVNCAALPAHLVEAELFGHVRGAFTDAGRDKAGLFELADGGTLFLDEIGEMDRSLQAKLLRVLEERSVRRLGDVRDRPIDVRVVSATNADLEEAVADGRFREDLYFRLAHVPIDTPALRDRPDDVAELFEVFLGRAARTHRRPPLGWVPEVLERLRVLPWPGNVRELQNLCERLAIFAADPITVDQLPEPYRTGRSRGVPGGPDALRPDGPIVPLRELRADVERAYIQRVLGHTGGNMTEAAELLGLRRSYLYEKLERLGIPRGSSTED